MLPLIPGAIPECVQDGWVEPKLQLAPRVAAQCSVVVEITFAQWHMEPSAPEIGRKREDAAGKECLAVSGRLAGHEKRAQCTIRKYGGDFGIGEQSVIASARLRLTNDVECPLQSHSLSVPHARCS